jgi:replicative DNA helicase
MTNIIKDPKEILKLEEELANYEGEDRVVSSHELAEEFSKTEDSVFRYQLGIPTIDRLLDGVEGGELVEIIGPSGEGKSTLMMTLTRNLADAGVRFVWFSLEVTPRQFLNKLKKQSDRELPLFYMPAKNNADHFKWLEQRIVEAVVKYNVQAVFIDDLHSIYSLYEMNNQNSSLNFGHLATMIKDIALAHNVVLFLQAHTADNKTAPTAEPRKEDVRDSGLIIRKADTVLGIWRVNNDADKAMKNKRPKDLEETDTWSKIKVLKNRREGTVGFCIVDHQNHYLKEIDPHDEDIDW